MAQKDVHDDGALSRRCRQGDAAAWRELVARLTPLVYRTALRLLGSPAQAEDACQEVFVKIHRSFDTFDPTRPLAPWAARITYHHCLRQLATGGQRMADDSSAEALDRLADNPGHNPEYSTASAEEAAILEQALSRLAAQDRTLLALRYAEGLSDAELAEATTMPVGTVKTRLFRARARLKELLHPFFKEGRP